MRKSGLPKASQWPEAFMTSERSLSVKGLEDGGMCLDRSLSIRKVLQPVSPATAETLLNLGDGYSK